MRASHFDPLDPEGVRLPIKLDSTSNGEFVPVPLPRDARLANRLARERADENARRLGVDRRAFLVSACGAASSLLAMNDAFARSGPRGGFFAVPREAALDRDAATAALEGGEFIFDVQGHHVNPDGAWRRGPTNWERLLRFFPQARCEGAPSIDCLSARHFVKEVFLDSDTDLAVLSFVPSTDDDAPLTIEEADATRALVDALDGTQRLLLHGRVQPNLPGDLDRMDALAERWKVAAWKTYTQYGPAGHGYWLDDAEAGIPFIEKARALDVKVICIHKGLPLQGMKYEHSTCRDVGAVARRFPDVSFIVYHSGFETARNEGPYTPGGRGIDSLVDSLLEHEVPPHSNVYAELGSTWRFLMRDPDAAAHALGKLLKYVGGDRVLWGTDSIWYGSPQDQIQAFRSFQIAPELREKHGYPELTPALRAQVFGLAAAVPYGIRPDEVRAARDRVSEWRDDYRDRPAPSFRTYGPRTRRELLHLWRLGGGPG